MEDLTNKHRKKSCESDQTRNKKPKIVDSTQYEGITTWILYKVDARYSDTERHKMNNGDMTDLKNNDKKSTLQNLLELKLQILQLSIWPVPDSNPLDETQSLDLLAYSINMEKHPRKQTTLKNNNRR